MTRSIFAARSASPAIRTVSEDADIRVIEGLGIPFGGPYPGNADDYGTRATAKTNFYWDFTGVPDRRPNDPDSVPARYARPVSYGHGFDDMIPLHRLGAWSPIRQDKFGVWVRAQIDKHDEYYEAIAPLLDQDKLGFSTGSVEHNARIAKNGDWIDWPLFEIALTPTPSNPWAALTARAAKTSETLYRIVREHSSLRKDTRAAGSDMGSALSAQQTIAYLMDCEADEPEQLAALKTAFDALSTFIAAESKEVGTAEGDEAPMVAAEAWMASHRIGRRNAGPDLDRIDAIHDMTVELGASAHATDEAPDDETHQEPARSAAMLPKERVNAGPERSRPKVRITFSKE
jgi:hypothetical protein